MKKGLLNLIILIFPIVIFSQYPFQSITFKEALKLSAKKGQLIFLNFESETCNQCNTVADKAFENKELANLLDQSFVCIKISASNPERSIIRGLYNINNFGIFFIDQNSTLIHSFLKSTSQASAYQNEIGIALTNASEGVRISELEKEYKNGDRSISLLQSLLVKRKNLNLQTDSLLDEYVSILPVDSLTSTTTLTFISSMAPILGSLSDIQLRKNYSNFNIAWYSLTLPVRVNINNRIIYKSLQKAINEKNEVFAKRVASFASSTFTSNTQGAAKSFEYNMLQYYKGSADTLKYLTHAIDYYDKYFMNLSIDSLKRKDSMNMRSLFEVKKAELPPIEKYKKGDTIKVQKSIRYASQLQYYSNELNTVAWSFYKMCNDIQHLNKALQWSKKANEIYESAECLDTNARLLYKTGNKNDAMLLEEKAITITKRRGFSTKEFETVIIKMKNNEENIDN